MQISWKITQKLSGFFNVFFSTLEFEILNIFNTKKNQNSNNLYPKFCSKIFKIASVRNNLKIYLLFKIAGNSHSKNTSNSERYTIVNFIFFHNSFLLC